MLREIQLPAVGTAGGFGGKKRQNIILLFTNYNARNNLFFDPNVGKSAVYEKPSVILKAMITSPNKCFILQKMEQNSNDYHL
jgi:prolyl oligopeptidase